MTHLVCDSCRLKLEHVQTCLSTQVCLTQHPNDTLRLFQELNCHTSYMFVNSVSCCGVSNLPTYRRSFRSFLITGFNSILLSLIIPNCLWLRVSISLSSFNVAHPLGEPGRAHFIICLFCLFLPLSAYSW
jgi:hypothetical protein